MSKQEKALERLCREPTVADFTWDELVSLIESLGFELINGKGSRKKFRHLETNLTINLHRPHPSSIVKKYALRYVVDELKMHGLI